MPNKIIVSMLIFKEANSLGSDWMLPLHKYGPYALITE
jgi:hypothetical protein